MRRNYDGEPGEWQREPGNFGRRYRIVGGIKEYEMQIQTAGGMITESQLEAENRAAKPQKERPAQRPDCPFKDGVKNSCSGESCALYLKGGCTLAQIGSGQPAKDTAGLQCPFNRYKCSTTCALYKKGCMFTAVIKESEGKDNEQV